MDAITFSSARSNLAATMDRVCDDSEPIIITRSGQRAVVMLFRWRTSMRLKRPPTCWRSPKNARRLLDAVAQLEAGKGREQALVE